MRKIAGRVLIAIGGFLVVAGLLTSVWAPGVVKKTPVDVDQTTRLDGEATKLGETFPVNVTSITKADSEASTDDTTIWVNTSCVVANTDGNAPDCVDGEDERLVSATVGTFATDRVTALGRDHENLPEGSTPYEGIVNKFPFDTEKTDYPYWDGTLGRTVDMEFLEETEMEGLTVYHFAASVEDEAIEVAEGTPGTYSQAVDIYVEPITGAVVNQEQSQQRYLEDGTEVLDLNVAFTDDQLATSLSEAKDNAANLTLITETVPRIGFIGGAIALALGAVLLLMGRRSQAAHSAHAAAAPA
ncbi:DUF3068 domain-containing protein [Nocardioides marmotae]|uniref:DUF3068 domain-containing protein n=1 Tax=Nocardioides marmotae TaxID=2663857 RepID=UPI0012B567D2|nr:DUF3068 domain-containing protein [Nocardioides marmotae]MTB83146.1 DUF3068 domain-containing protein [Nocardioides marmotae]